MIVSVQAEHPQSTSRPVPVVTRQNAGGSLLDVCKGIPLGCEEGAEKSHIAAIAQQ